LTQKHLKSFECPTHPWASILGHGVAWTCCYLHPQGFHYWGAKYHWHYRENSYTMYSHMWSLHGHSCSYVSYCKVVELWDPGSCTHQCIIIHWKPLMDDSVVDEWQVSYQGETLGYPHITSTSHYSGKCLCNWVSIIS
jgi:hypothetical protein